MERQLIPSATTAQLTLASRLSIFLPLALGIFGAVSLTPARAASERFFRITVVDDSTGRGVPLVELKTVNGIELFTDSAGVIAFDEPGLMDREVFFHVSSHGYDYPADGFGIRGKRLLTTRGGQAVIKIKRQNIAERLYRVTGQGIYRDSLLLGDQAPLSNPVLNAQVLGSDSVVNAVYQGKLYWFWGDTNRPSYPLGNFHVPGARSKLPDQGGLNPNDGIELDYYVDDDGFAKPTCKMEGEGPTWISGLVSVPDAAGKDRLLAMYMKIRGGLQVDRRGIAEFDSASNEFQHRLEIPLSASGYPFGHPFRYRDSGTEYVYFADPIPTVRVKATAESLLDLSQYEAWSCLEPKTSDREPKVRHGPDGSLDYRWLAGSTPISLELERQWVKRDLIADDQRVFRLIDQATGQAVIPHRGSVYWNPYRQSWVMIFTEVGGRSHLGEVWFAEAKSPLGPWREAIRIATHRDYSFYNPKQHPMLAEQHGRYIYFEGTYTHTFSGNSQRTPRYDYNQIMYRLDLADPRLGSIAE